MKTVASIIKASPSAVFIKYQGGILVYRAGTFIIRIPAVELGDAHVMDVERTASLMKWIARELKEQSPVEINNKEER